MTEEETPVSGKGRPTPSRKQAQAANARPLIADRHNKDAVKARRLADREARERARLGAIMGDEKYLSARDKGPQRKFARDFVDSRFNVGELIIPVMFVVLLLTLINNPTVQLISIGAVWGYVGLAIIDAIFMSRRVTKLLADQYGADNVQSGTKWYSAMRAMQLRSLRVPKPQARRRKPSK